MSIYVCLVVVGCYFLNYLQRYYGLREVEKSFSAALTPAFAATVGQWLAIVVLYVLLSAVHISNPLHRQQ